MLTPAWYPLRPHYKQSLAWRTKSRFVNLACGRGSGKTEIARRYIVRHLPIKKPQYMERNYFYALPTYNQAKRVAWRPLCDLVPRDWIKRIHESELRIETVFASNLYVVGMDVPARIEGMQWDGSVLDESCDIKPGAFSRSVIPALTHRNGWCWRIGVPKRAGVGAQEFKEFFDSGLDGKTPDVESYTWPSSDILTKEQLDWARLNLDERDFLEQFGASWVTIGGLVFYAFNETTNVSADMCVYNPNRPLIIGSDFNVDPMAWVVCQSNGPVKMCEDTSQELYVLDELWIRNTNTRESLNALYEKYKTHRAGFEFFGDATSRSRNTRASESDYMQIRTDARFSEYTQAGIHYPRSNPNRANRFASCNMMFCSAANTRRLYIHPKCKNLIKDLNSRAYKQGSNEVEDEGDIGHITDALGYVVHRMFPITLKVESMPAVSIRK